MTISLPQRKIDNLIEKAQGLKGKMRVALREISQFLGSMQFKQASSPAVSSALSFAINSKFKEVPKSLSIRLLNCGYFGHSFNSRSGLVDSGNEVQLYKKNLYPPVKCSNFYRLRQFRMGCHSKSGQNSRLMERQSVGLAHQYKGTNGSFSCSTAVSSQLPEWSCTAVFRQYNSCCLLKSSRGTKSVQLSAFTTEIWCWCLERNIYLLAIHISGLKNLFTDPLSHLKNLSPEWMLNRAVFRQIVAIYGLPDIDVFASALNHQVSASWKERTEKQHESAWKQFCRWCHKKSVNPFSCHLESILLYLSDLYEKGL